jgi:hypothetical protein
VLVKVNVAHVEEGGDQVPDAPNFVSGEAKDLEVRR